MNRWLRRLGWLGIGLALLVMLSWMVLPRVIQVQGEHQLTALLGRQVRIGQVNFRPWSLELTIRDISIAGTAPDAPLLTVARLYANAEVSSLWHLAPVLSAFEIDAPALRITRLEEGRYDIDDIIERLTVPAAASASTPVSPAPASTPASPARARAEASRDPSAAASDTAQPAPASAPAAEEATGPRFALHNLQLRDGSIRFDDRPVSRVHDLRHLVVTLPFLSNLPSDVRVEVEPRLAFALDDAAFDTGAQSTPFAQDRSTSMTLRIGGAPSGTPDNGELDLASYAGYLPQSVPLRLVRGFLATELDVGFSVQPDGTPSVGVSGQVRARDVELVEPGGAPLARWRRLGVDLREVRPFARRVALGDVRLEGATVELSRNAAGQLNLERLAGASSEPPNGTPPAGNGWQLGIEQVVVDDSQVVWHDATTQPAAAYLLDELSFGAKQLRWPSDAALPVTLSAVLRAADAAQAAGADAAASADTAAGGTGPAPGAPAPAASSASASAPAPAPARRGARAGTVTAQATRATPPAPGSALPAAGDLLARLEADGEAGPKGASLTLRVDELRLAGFQPYVAPLLSPTLRPRIEGQARLAGRLDWAEGDTPRLAVGLDEAQLDGFKLVASDARQRTNELASLQQLRVARLDADLRARQVTLDRVELRAPSIAVVRAANGRLNVQDWAAPPAPEASPSSPAPDWKLKLAALTLDGGRVRLTDLMAPTQAAAGAPLREAPAIVLGQSAPQQMTDSAALDRDVADQGPLVLTLQPLRLTLSDLAFDTAGPTTARATLRTQLAVGDRPAARRQQAPARVEWQGRVGWAPLLARGAVRLEGLPLQAFERYAQLGLRIDLLQALGDYRGDVAVRESAAGLGVDAQGQLRIAGLHVATRPADPAAPVEDLVTWHELNLDRLRVGIEPGRKPRIEIGQAALDGFYSRLVVTEAGRFNLLDIAEPPPAAGGGTPATPAEPTPAAAAAAMPASSAQSFPVATSNGGSFVGSRASRVGAGFAPAAANAPPAAPPSALPVDVSVDAIRLHDGRIAFTDRFVKPNYSADLSELNGSVGAFRSGSTDMAPIEMSGRVAGTGRLQVAGRINPTADPLALDIDAKTTELELPALSPYAGKYAGYVIDRGKMSLEVSYDIRPDGQLDAKHHLVLDQLQFGERVESPSATSLPVRLAIALLKDRNGVIDLNLPVSGSIQNPQFSVFDIVLKMIGNLIVKAVTAPFALLTGGGGDNQDMSAVEFTPGTAAITPQGREALGRIAKALVDRPQLRLSVTGGAATGLEEADLRRATLERRLQGDGRREQLRRGDAPAEAPPPAPAAAGASQAAAAASGAGSGEGGEPSAPPIDPAERERLLERLYRDTPLPDKPRNFLGLTKRIPAPEMEAKLLAAQTVSSDQWRELALQRSMAVRDALIAQGLPSDRLFLASPKVYDAAGPADDEGRPWTPRVQLSVAAP